MSTELSATGLRRDAGFVLMWLGGCLLLVCLWGLLISGQVSLLCAVAIGIPLVALAVYDRQAAVEWTLVYVILLGDLRRLVAEIAAPPAFDPLLLILPAVTVILATPPLLRLRMREPLSKSVLALLFVMGMQVFNPVQGGLGVGLSGVFFYVIPVLWFWIGRDFGSPDLVEKIIYRVIVPLGICAGVLGLSQSFIGFLPYQQDWIAQVGRVYTSLFIGASVRPFGFSVSAAEYATLLEVSIALAVAAYFAARRVWIGAVPLLAIALFLSGGRGLTIKLVVVLCVLWIVRKGQRLSPLKLFGLAALGGAALLSLSLVAGFFATPAESGSHSKSAAEDALAHQLGGLAHPLDQRYSSASLHSNMVVTGFLQGFTNPLGRGLGSTTFAAQKLGTDSGGGSSELDFSDMFIALGLAGGALYIAVVIFGLRETFTYVRQVRLTVGLPVLALLIATLGGWLIEGQYSTCSLVFFILGSVVHQTDRYDAELSASLHRCA
jgi:hypothetical protein